MKAPSGDAWVEAVRLLERWLDRGERIDALLESADAGRRGAAEDGVDRARCQHLLFGAVRNFGRLDAAVGARVPRRPRARLRALLLVAGFELLDAGTIPGAAAEGQAAKIVHHAVTRAKVLLSPAEARLVNAVLRRMADGAELRDAPPDAGAGAAEWARAHSHPEWLVRRWLGNFGPAATRSLLVWNQTPAPVYARWRGQEAPPTWLQPSPWSGFWIVPAGQWAQVGRLAMDGSLYLQDPATRMAAELLDPRPGETILDLCAAPGGKSLLLADMMEDRAAARPPEVEAKREGSAGPRQAKASAGSGRRGDEAVGFGSPGIPPPHVGGHPRQRGSGSADEGPLAAGPAPAGRIVAVDLPDDLRIGRLTENLAKVRRVGTIVVRADVRRLTAETWRAHGLPDRFPAVMLDAPCSNTGVMRHRVDVKWRLREPDIAKMAARQLTLLTASARWVAPAGRLVYSTCSLEPEENEGVVAAFLRAADAGWTLEAARHCRPWDSGTDGAGAFLLRKNA